MTSPPHSLVSIALWSRWLLPGFASNERVTSGPLTEVLDMNGSVNGQGEGEDGAGRVNDRFSVYLGAFNHLDAQVTVSRKYTFHRDCAVEH